MGLFEIFTGEDIPEYTPPPMDPLARKMIQTQVDRAMTPEKDLEKAYSAGVDDAKGLLQDSGKFDEGLSYGDKALGAVIKNKFSGEANRSMARTKQGIKDKANADHFNRLNKTSQLVAEEQRINHEKELMKYQAKMNRQRARSAIVGQVLGIGGAVVGGMYGGPMGAMAGYQIGQGAGGMTGGE